MSRGKREEEEEAEELGAGGEGPLFFMASMGESRLSGAGHFSLVFSFDISFVVSLVRNNSALGEGLCGGQKGLQRAAFCRLPLGILITCE